MLAQPLRKVHRVTGLLVAIPVTLLVITGLPLQFTDSLALGVRPISWNWVLDSYHIQAPTDATRSGPARQLGQTLWVHERILAAPSPLVGAVERAPISIVALRDRILLVPDDLDIPVETIQSPASIQQLGQGAQQLLLIDTGANILQSRDLGATWFDAPANPTTRGATQPAWVKLEQLTANPGWQQQYRASKLSWQRWLQDLHSGRYFGRIGEWIMALASAALILLALTGLVVWLRLRR